jgi:hypothetical protein
VVRLRGVQDSPDIGHSVVRSIGIGEVSAEMSCDEIEGLVEDVKRRLGVGDP